MNVMRPKEISVCDLCENESSRSDNHTVRMYGISSSNYRIDQESKIKDAEKHICAICIRYIVDHAWD